MQGIAGHEQGLLLVLGEVGEATAGRSHREKCLWPHRNVGEPKDARFFLP